jgi:hypothetical protein
MAGTLIVFIGLRIAIAQLLRPHYLPPLLKRRDLELVY